MTTAAEAMATIDIIAVNATQVTNAIDHLRALVYAAHDRANEADAHVARADAKVAEMQRAVDRAAEVFRNYAADDYTKRLESELHKRLAHPDYEYVTTKGPRKAWEVEPPEQEAGPAWEQNTDYHGGWERFEYHEEAYWRRPILGARPCPYCSRFGTEETIALGDSCDTCGWEPGE